MFNMHYFISTPLVSLSQRKYQVTTFLDFFSGRPKQSQREGGGGGGVLLVRKLVQGLPTPRPRLPPNEYFYSWPSQGGCFGSLVVLDNVCGYVLLFLLDIKKRNR